MPTRSSSGYVSLLKKNRPFRFLWYGQVISELGDWINSIAIYALILKLGGSGMAVALAMMAKLLPIFLVSPLAGVLIDRMNRKTLMIFSDVLRFFIVLCFLLIDDKDALWMVYLLTVFEVAMSACFEPARRALLPSIVPKEHLVAANALSGATWSVMLAFGAVLGGVIVSLLGIRAAFALDATTFLISAWFISRIETPQKAWDTLPTAPVQGRWEDLLEGFRYLLREPVVLVLATLKSGLAVSGGVMTLIPLYAHQMLSQSTATSMGIGLMYSARGVGAAIGPFIFGKLFGDTSRTLQISIAAAYFLEALFLLIFAQAQFLWTATLSLGLSTLFGSIVWVFSSALLHMEAEDRFLGRVFGIEMALLTLVMGVSNGVVGLAIDHWGLSPSEVASRMGLMLILPGVAWSGFTLFVHNRLKQGKCVGSINTIDPSGFNPLPLSSAQDRVS